MSGLPLRNVRRPSPAMPASSSRPTLAVNTSLQPTLSSSASLSATSSTPEQPYPKYPLPIPFDKQDKAVQLYKRYQDAKREEEFEQLQSGPLSAPSNHHGYHLSVPNTPAPQSATSRTSSQRGGRAASVSTSAYGMGTDISSIMSFEGNESPSAQKSELSAYDGTKVKHRTRKRFNNTKRARTALIRHLGSCWVCHKRRVPCEIEKHHDVQLLEALLQAKANKVSAHSRQQPLSTNAGPSQQDIRSASGEQTAGVATQTDFLGLGDQLLQIPTDMNLEELDIQSPAFGDIPPQDLSASAPLYNQEPDLLALNLNPYATYQHGDMLHIGTWRVDDMFECKHPYCFDVLPSLEALQLHFEDSHFPFTRLDPALRLTCGACSSLNDLIAEPCYNCGSQVEIRVYGNYIRTPSYDHYSPSAPASLRNFTPSTPYNPSYNIPQATIPDDPASYNGGNQGYTFPPRDNAYGGGGPSPGSQGQGYGYTPDPYNLPPNGNQYQGHTYQRALHIVEIKPIPFQPSRPRKALLALSLLSLALTLSLSYTWALTQLRSLPGLKTNLPVIGFVGIVASAVMYSSVLQRKSERVVKESVGGSGKCPLHAPVRWMGARVRAPESFVLGGRFS